jgi:hypothetical protein
MILEEGFGRIMARGDVEVCAEEGESGSERAWQAILA